MLQFIHSRLSGILAWIIIFVVGPGLVLWGINYYVQRSSRTDVIAKVNGAKIYRHQLENIYEKFIKSFPKDILTNKVQLTLKNQAIDLLIFNSVLQTTSKGLGLFVTEQQINNIITSDPNFLVNNEFSNEKFQQYIRNAGFYSLKDFYDNAKLQVMIKQYELGILDSEFVTDYEYKQFADFSKQTRNIEYIKLPLDKFINNKTQIAQDVIENYYKTNKDNFKEHEKVSIQYLELNLDKIKHDTVVTDQEIANYYQQHKDAYIEPTEWKIAHILLKFNKDDSKDKKAKYTQAQNIIKEFNKGQKFNILAKKHSLDTETAQQGGILPWLKENVIDNSIVNELKVLKKPNLITPVIETSKGYVIVKLLDVNKGKERSLNDLKNEIKTILINTKAQASFGEMSEQLADLTYSSPDSLEEASRILKLPIQKTPLFEKGQKDLDGILKNNKIIDNIYSDEVYYQKNNSYPIQIDDNNTVIVLRIDKIMPERVKKIEEIQSEVKQAILTEQARKKQIAFSNNVVQNLQANQSVNEMLAKYALKIEKVINLSADDTKLDPKLVELIFSMSNRDKENVKELVLDPKNLIIIKLLSVNHANIKNISKVEQSKIMKLAQEYNNKIILTSYVESLKANSTIKIYKDLIEEAVV